MQVPSNAQNDFINVINEICTSGRFLKMVQSGRADTVIGLLVKRVAIASALGQIEAKLRACNDPVALTEFAVWCHKSKRNFGSELPKKAQALEAQKLQWQTELKQIDQLLAQEKAEFEWTTSTEANSLVPRVVRATDPLLAARNSIIDQNLDQSHEEICTLLDFDLARDDGALPQGFPDTWVRDYGVHTFVEAYRHTECRNRVHKMFSARRRQGLPENLRI